MFRQSNKIMYLTSHIFTKQIGFEMCVALLRRSVHTKTKVNFKDVYLLFQYL